MNLFIDSSVALAASISATGASRLIFDLAATNDWSLIISPWVLRETRDNLAEKPQEFARNWVALRKRSCYHVMSQFSREVGVLSGRQAA